MSTFYFQVLLRKASYPLCSLNAAWANGKRGVGLVDVGGDRQPPDSECGELVFCEVYRGRAHKGEAQMQGSSSPWLASGLPDG